MLPENLRQSIISLIHREVVPAIGCTEPIAVALATARAKEALGAPPAKISASLSANIIKNAMGVGIPGTGRIGLPIAIALGATVGRSAYGLEVLRDVAPGAVERATPLTGNGAIDMSFDTTTAEKLYIDITVEAADGRRARAVISGGHTTFVYIESPEGVILDNRGEAASAGSSCTAGEPKLTMATVWEFAMTTPLDELRFILETRRMNKAAAEQSFTGRYGHSVGRTLHSERQRAVMGDSIFSRILSYTSAACDARMAGAAIPVMSNSGSGNQGISATLPVVIYAEETFANEEQTVRALTLSNLTVIYIKQSLGRLSALCGCVVAATGSSCGICYLMGGDYDKVCATVKNMVGNLSGMVCDGAKPGCALKVASGASTAVISAMIAMEGHCVSAVEGIVDDDVDRTIANLSSLGRDSMNETDATVLQIMTSK